MKLRAAILSLLLTLPAHAEGAFDPAPYIEAIQEHGTSCIGHTIAYAELEGDGYAAVVVHAALVRLSVETGESLTVLRSAADQHAERHLAELQTASYSSESSDAYGINEDIEACRIAEERRALLASAEAEWLARQSQ